MKRAFSMTALMLALGTTAYAQNADMAFEDADADNNGTVSLLEAQEAGIEDFDRHDLNEDGLLGEEEYRMAQRSAQAGTNQGAEPGAADGPTDYPPGYGDYPPGDMPDPAIQFEEDEPGAAGEYETPGKSPAETPEDAAGPVGGDQDL